MDELRRIAPFYKGSHQQANIAAAINWHAQFYPAEIVPADLVIFQRGQKVDKSDMRPGEAPWEEVSQLHAFLRDVLTTLI